MMTLLPLLAVLAGWRYARWLGLDLVSATLFSASLGFTAVAWTFAALRLVWR